MTSLKKTSTHSAIASLFSLCSIFISQGAAAQHYQIDLEGQRFSANQAATPQQTIVTIPAKVQFTADINGAFKQYSSTLFPGEIEFRFLTVGDAKGAEVFDLLGWRTGLEYDVLDTKGAQATRAEGFFSAPKLLLKHAQNRQAMETPAEWQAQYQFESFLDLAGRPATVVIDKRTGDVVNARSANFTYEYQNYSGEQAARTAQSVKIKVGENLVANWNSVKVVELAKLDAQEFSRPTGYQAKQAPGALRVDKIADNTYRINGSASAYHMHFVVGDNSIALFDAPIFPNEIATIKTIIDNIAPGKKISHIVFSHTHRDHIGGSAQLAQDGTQIITGHDGKIAIQRQLGDKINAKAIEITSPMKIDLGGRQIQINPAPSSHTSDMLIAYDSQSKTLFQGDFFMMPEVGPAPVGFAVNRELAQYLTSLAIMPERILSVHGRVGTLEELRQTVQKLDTQRTK